MESIKALSINQPWAWAIVNGYKPVENRDWNTEYRGKVLIHAGKKFDDEGYEFIKKMLPTANVPIKDDFFMGGIVGSAYIVDCVKQMESEWFFGEYGFVIADARPCAPIICRGALGFFTPDYNSRYKEKTK